MDVALTGLIVSYTLTWAHARGLAPAQAITLGPFRPKLNLIPISIQTSQACKRPQCGHLGLKDGNVIQTRSRTLAIDMALLTELSGSEGRFSLSLHYNLNPEILV